MLALGAALCSALCGCWVPHIGNGKPKTEERAASPFDAIVTEGEVDVTVVMGDAEGVTVTCDSNLLEYIEVETEGSTLVISERRGHNIEPRAECFALVTAVDLFALESHGSGNLRTRGSVADLDTVLTSGSGDVLIEDLGCTEIELVTTGSGDATISGAVAHVTLRTTGSGDVEAADLMSQSALVRTTGSGDVKFHATETVDIRTTGSGDVHVWGDPGDRNEHRSGSGDIRYH